MRSFAAQSASSARSASGASLWSAIEPLSCSLARALPSAAGKCAGRDPGRNCELDGAGVAVAPAERVRGALSDDVSADDDGDAVGEPFCLIHVVRRQEDRLAEIAEAFDHIPGRSACRGVEAGGRLVEEDQLRVADEREGEVESAALATREAGAPAGRPFLRARRARSSRRRISGGCSSRRRARGTREPSGRGRARTPAGRSRCGRAIHASPRRDRRRAPTPRRSSGAWNPSRISTVVVLPAPFGPRKAKISPRATSRSIPRTASMSP